uniref:Uncharacterized protein n=1 Tax=Sphaerodactylus townsendi TaxID=933632 RepID=A0ACB8EGJ7_9SAUR
MRNPTSSGVSKLYNMFPALGFLLGAHKTVLNNRDELYAFIQATFIEHLKDLDENDQRSFIDSFLVRQQEEKNQTNRFFHNKNLKAVVGNLLAAGTETTSTTLRWGLLLMMKYPEIQCKVQEEIAQVIGSAQPRTEHRAKMPYTDAVVHEIQRFSNILPMNLPHATTVDVTFKGYSISKEIPVMLPTPLPRGCVQQLDSCCSVACLQEKGGISHLTAEQAGEEQQLMQTPGDSGNDSASNGLWVSPKCSIRDPKPYPLCHPMHYKGLGHGPTLATDTLQLLTQEPSENCAARLNRVPETEPAMSQRASTSNSLVATHISEPDLDGVNSSPSLLTSLESEDGATPPSIQICYQGDRQEELGKVKCVLKM